MLAGAGFKDWMVTRDLLQGRLWRDSVGSAIENSRLLVVLLSQNAFKKSGFVGKELSLALDTLQEPHEGYSSLIPVRLEPVDVPIEQLREIQWVDLFDEHGRERLVDAIRYLMSMQNQ